MNIPSMRKYAVLGMLAVCLSIASAVLANAQVQPPQRLVTIEGSAVISVTPDKAYIVVGVESEGSNASEAKTANDKSMAALFQSVRRLGVEDRDILTSGLSLQPVYDYTDGGKGRFIRYTMSNTVTITVRTIENIGRYIDACVNAGGNVIRGVSYGSSKIDDLRRQARIQATKNARERAQEMLQAVGNKVGKLMTLSEYGGGAEPMYADRSFKAAGNSGTSVSAGDIDVRVTVSASFEIE